MSTKKVYAVVFYEQAVEQLGRIVALWLRQDEMGSYMYCKSIDPAGPYFRMILEFPVGEAPAQEMELQVPHAFIKCIFYAADFKRIGFQ